MRHGSTLVELTLALAVLAMALGVTLESMVHVSSYGGFQARQGDLAEQSRRLAGRLHADLANTAWFTSYNPSTKRQERIMPLVLRGDASGFGDELHFLRLRSERSVGATPDHSQVAAVDFAREAPTPMEHFARARGVRSLLLNPAWEPDQPGSAFAIPTWESANRLDFADAQDLTKLRHYRLVVRPDLETTGRGVLLREYRDGTKGPWITDERVADNLVAFKVLTNRELPSLHANQLQVSVTLQADDPATGKRRDRLQHIMIIAMRSGFSE
ncbi:MAG: hypothetical protein H0W78_00655 [Planctomycetes bacterium]|nr:hypothetical protein [Planctomycetota bacterium]